MDRPEIRVDPNPAIAISRSKNPNGKNHQARHRSIRSRCWSALAENTRRRIAEKSAPVAVTTQEGIDGYHEKAMRIAATSWSCQSRVMCSNGQDNLTSRGRVSLRKTDGWNLKNHSYLPVARHLREKTHSSMFVVTIREREERGICSTALKELLKIIKDQIEERSVVVLVRTKSPQSGKIQYENTVKR